LLLLFLAVGVFGNFAAVLVLVGALLTAESAELTGAQLLTTGAVVWVTNVIVFGLCFWTLDAGGPARRAVERPQPDFSLRTRSATDAAGTRASRTTSTSP
jgi:hypothetical protein